LELLKTHLKTTNTFATLFDEGGLKGIESHTTYWISNIGSTKEGNAIPVIFIG